VRVWPALAVGVAVALLVSACGGSDNRLSASEYRTQLRTVARESDTAEHGVEKGFHATSVGQLVKVLGTFEASEKRIGGEVAGLNAPLDAEPANSELARGLDDTASEVQALIPRIKKMPSTHAAVAYLSKTPTTKGGSEVDKALAQLKQLGYIKSVS
jgi:hypothetical protein